MQKVQNEQALYSIPAHFKVLDSSRQKKGMGNGPALFANVFMVTFAYCNFTGMFDGQCSYLDHTQGGVIVTRPAAETANKRTKDKVFLFYKS